MRWSAWNKAGISTKTNLNLSSGGEPLKWSKQNRMHTIRRALPSSSGVPKAERHFQLFETKRTWFLCERFQNN